MVSPARSAQELDSIESQPAAARPLAPAPEALFSRAARGLVSRAVSSTAPDGPELAVLQDWSAHDPGVERVRACLAGPALRLQPLDAALHALSRRLSLTLAESLAVALAFDVERDPIVGRTLSFLQEPVGAARPTLGLLATACARAGVACAVDELGTGAAIRTGLLTLTDSTSPLPERAVALPTHLLLALSGREACPDGVHVGLGEGERMALPDSVRAEAARYAHGLAADGTLLVRSGDPAEARAVAAEVAARSGATPLFIERDAPAGLAPWLILRQLVPVFVRRMGPGERTQVPALPGWTGPVLVVAGVEGAVETPGGTPLCWRVPLPAADERAQLWAAALGGGDGRAPGELARTLAQSHRHGSGRIAELGRLSRQHAAMDAREQPALEDVYAASWHAGSGLEMLAQPIADRVRDDALVLTPAVRRELELLLARCRQREGLVHGLGSAAVTRYRHGVRALFVGASGTGKTLAVSWLACRLALPLYRVDMAAVVSKYIGETEKNLSELLARAECSEVVLFFDEADAMFGKRTEVKQANDRFANAQTNYLLQRIESYEGIIVLASNSRARFDAAFSRRLDQIVEFTAPGPDERRALWQAHLGQGHSLSPRELNELAMSCDLAGGHVRNAVLAAAVLASEAGRPIAWSDVLAGLVLECRKLGLPLPAALSRR